MVKKDLGFQTERQYFTAMEKISKEVRKRLLKIFEEIVSEFELKNFTELWENAFLKMWEARVLKNENPKYLRPLLTLIGYKFINCEEDFITSSLPQKLIDIATAVESLNIATYQVNLAIDQKSGIETEQEIITQFLLADITLSKGIESILKSEIEITYTKELIKRYLLANNMTKHEQFINVNILKIENWPLIFRENYNLWRKTYVYRRLRASGYTIAYSLFSGGMIALKEKQEDKKLQALWNLGLLFGKTAQLMNDIADLAGDLPYKQVFADYKNGLLTFPFFWILKSLKEDGKEKLEKKVIERKVAVNNVVKIFLDYGGLKVGEKILNREFTKIKHFCWQHFGKNKSNYFLSNVYNLLFNNKFFKKLRNTKYAQ